MKTWLREFFVFSNREHKGSIGLLLLLALLMLLPKLLVLVETPEKTINEEILQQAFEQYQANENKPRAQELFKFNPNTVSKEDLLRLGLKEKTANLLINYRNKKGYFRNAADFKKIYTLSAATFARLEPYLTFEHMEDTPSTTKDAEQYDTLNYKKFMFDPNTISLDSLKLLGLLKNEINHLDNLRKKGIRFFKKEQFKVSSWRPNKMAELQSLVCIAALANIQTPPSQAIIDTVRQPTGIVNKQLFDINVATHEQLLSINGIGNYYARTILEKRDLLGSFVLLEQLADFMPDSLYRKVLPRLALTAKPVKKLKINHVDLQLLQQYPGLRYKAAIIVNYRNHHGNFRSILDLWKVDGIRKDILDKLAPYLDFEGNEENHSLLRE